ncbi:MAG: hypothetical protein EOP56_01565 [Sphingobacteriales bacterium]|nr:MAG: hypothetical protein EOP56_01565 [Sphingobacteriales bacterium]
MDKNMINIDDLLRQRLGGGEEKERPGGWLQMRDLLDKEMPVQQPGSAFNWRRMLGVITGVVAISAVGLGGYQAVTSFRNNGDVTKGATASTGHTSGGNGKLAQIAANSDNQFSGKSTKEVSSGTANVAGNSNAKNNSGTNGNTSSTTAGKAAISTPAASGNATAKAANKNAADKTDNSLNTNENGQSEKTFASTAGSINNNVKSAPVTGAVIETAGTSTETSTPNTNSRKKARIAKNSRANSSNTKTAGTVVNSGTVVTTPTEAAAKTNKAVSTKQIKKAKGNTTTSTTGLANTKATADNNNNNKPATQVTATGNTSNGSNANGGSADKVVVAKESIAKIETRESVTKEGKLKIDTISVGTVERDKFILAAAGEDAKPAIGSETVSPVDNTVVPASGIAAEESFKGEVAPASKNRRKKESIWSPKKLEEMVRDARFSTNEVMFYPGIVAGLNGLLGSNAMAGFQMGISGNLSLNQRWGIFSELKYVHRFNAGGNTFDSRDFGPIQQIVQNNQTTYKYTPTLTQYKINSLSAVELPVAVRYSFNTISVFMGVNYAYYFSTTPNPTPITEAPVTSSTEPKPQGIQLAPSDFGSMHGMGYMLGVGYNVSPAMHLDLRLANPMFSNANTPGTRAVSDKVFKAPSVQVNFNYNFIREKKIK